MPFYDPNQTDPLAQGGSGFSSPTGYFNPAQSDPLATLSDPTPEEYAARAQKAGLGLGRSFDEQEEILRKRGFPSEAIAGLMQDYKMQTVKRAYQGTVPGGVLEQFARDTIPFLDFVDVRGDKDYHEAKKKFAAGDQSPQVIDTIARYERLQEIDQEKANRSLPGALVGTAGGLPKVFGEFWGAGKVIKGFGGALSATPGRLGRFGQTLASEGGGLATHAQKMAVMAPLVPSFYLNEARQRNLEAGRDPLDPRGFPGPMLYAYGNLLVLNSLSKNIAGATTATRMAKAGGLGMLEQQGVDAVGGLWDEFAPEAFQTKTRFGLVGSMARGELGETAKHAAIQFMTFAAFRGVHEFQAKASAAEAKERMREDLKSFYDSAEAHWKKGMSEKAALEKATREAEEKARREMEAETPEKIVRRRATATKDAPVEEVGPTRPDANPELTHLEQLRTRRPLSPSEQAKLEKLRGSRPGTVQEPTVEAPPESPTIAPDGRPTEVGKTPDQPPIVDPRASREPEFGPESDPTPETAPEGAGFPPGRQPSLRDVAGKAAPGKPLVSPDPVRNIETLNKLLDEKGLNAQEKEVILARGDNNKLTEIARRMGLSRERVRQVEAAARGKLGIKESLAELGFGPSEQAANEAAFRRQSERGEVETQVGPTGKAEVPGQDAKRESMAKKINDRLDKITDELGKTTDQGKIDKLSREYEKLSGDLERLESRRLGMAEDDAISQPKVHTSVTPEKKAEFDAALEKALGKLNASPQVIKILKEGVREVEYYGSSFDVTMAAIKDRIALHESGEHPLPPKELARLSAWRDALMRGDPDATVAAGAHMNGKLYLDGANKSKKFDSKFADMTIDGVYIHEMGHNVDAGLGRLSDTPEFREAWQDEVAVREQDKPGVIGRFVLGKKTQYRLTEYGAKDPMEGFAEFFRLVYSGKNLAQIEAAFPRMSKVFKDNGVWPEKDTSQKRGAGSTRIKEVFGEKLVVNDATGEHVDLGSRPGTVQMAREAPREVETENERGLLESVQREPLDQTNRLVLADAIQEAGYDKNAEAVRREIGQPPGEQGVSHWRQLHPTQLQKMANSKEYQKIWTEEFRKAMAEGNPSPDATMIASNRATDRYFAEKEARGERLEFKLPENPEEFPEGDVPLAQFGPRMYEFTRSSAAVAIALGEVHPNYVLRNRPHKTNGPHDASIEYYSEGSNVRAELDRTDTGFGARYRSGSVTAHVDPHTQGMLPTSILSVTMRRKSFDEPVTLARVNRLLNEGWRLVELKDDVVRLDSPLRQRLRGEQALGVRTGEAQFSIAGKLSDLADRTIGKDAKEAVKKFFRGILTAKGEMPREGFEELLARDARMKAHAYDVSKAAKDLDRATGGKWERVPEPVRQQITAALRGDKAAMDSLPPDVQTATRNMRDKIDAMTNDLVKAGAIPDTLIPTVDANRGVYLTRTFEAFTDRANWYKKVSPEVVNRFQSWFASEARAKGWDITAKELESVTTEYLRGDTVADNIHTFFGSRKGTKDVGILTARKELPPELLDLLGEVKDPIANFAMTVARQAKLLENHVFQTRLKDLGLKNGWFSTERSNSHPFRVAGENSKGMDVLSDVFASEDVAKAFQGAYTDTKGPDWLKAYMKVLGLAKYSKTVLSPIAHIRQALGNTLFLTRNGYVLNETANHKLREMWKDTPEGREYARKMVELGLDDSVRGGELREVFGDAMDARDIFELPGGLTDKGMKRQLKRLKGNVEGAYRAEDLVMKVQAFENEKANYRRAHPEWTEAQVETEAARIVHAGFPTYSRVSGGIKWLRRFPLVGSFVSFSAEIARTTYNTGVQIRKELSDPNPAVRAIGVKRMKGMIGTFAGVALLSAASRLFANITLSEEDAIRRNLPEWSRDGQLLHLGKDKDGNYRVINLGHTDPHSFLFEPLQAALSGSRQGTLSVGDVARPIVSPFVGEEIGTRVALDIARNKTETGGRGGVVYNPEDTTLGKIQSGVVHAWVGFEPGIINQIKRTIRGGAGVKNPTTGQEYSLADELWADISGQRITGVNPKDSLTYKARTYTGRMSEAVREMNKAADVIRRTGGVVTPENIAAPRQRAEEMRRRVFSDVLEDVRAARLMGMTDGEIAKALRDGGVSQQEVGAILGGEYREKPLREVLRR